jgi:hypothetical protein
MLAGLLLAPALATEAPTGFKQQVTEVSGPQMVRDEGRGIQVYATVALIPKATN